MSYSNKLNSNIAALKRRTALVGVIWISIIIGSLIWNIYQIRRGTRELVKNEARTNLKKDQAIRLWASSHGGVYVSPDERTPPNPYLAHIPERDIKTTFGNSFTLMNPAYMLRQIMEDYGNLYGIKGHLTSLNLLNPINAPDEWERKILLAFEQDAKEMFEFMDIKGKSYLRLMQPMIIKKSCLRCHSHQGYTVGDIRGGISVAAPMEPYLIAAGKALNTILLTHGVIFVLGIIGIGFVTKRSRERIFEHDQDEKKLMSSNEQLKWEIEERECLEVELKKSEKQLQFLSSQLLIVQERERKQIAQDLHDSVEQVLSALKYGVESALNHANEGTTGKYVQSLKNLIPQIQCAVKDTSKIGKGLRPSLLDDLGIIATLSWFCREFQEIYSDIQIEKEITLEEDEVPEPLKLVIYRILQEGMNNVANHSGADLVVISLKKTESTLEFSIKDNGRGFDVTSTLSLENNKSGLGLVSMIRRTELSGGSLVIKSDKETGTTIRASWPC